MYSGPSSPYALITARCDSLIGNSFISQRLVRCWTTGIRFPAGTGLFHHGQRLWDPSSLQWKPAFILRSNNPVSSMVKVVGSWSWRLISVCCRGVKITALLACFPGMILRHRGKPLTSELQTLAPSSVRRDCHFDTIHSHLTPYYVDATWTLPFYSYILQ